MAMQSGCSSAQLRTCMHCSTWSPTDQPTPIYTIIASIQCRKKLYWHADVHYNHYTKVKLVIKGYRSLYRLPLAALFSTRLKNSLSHRQLCPRFLLVDHWLRILHGTYRHLLVIWKRNTTPITVCSILSSCFISICYDSGGKFSCKNDKYCIILTSCPSNRLEISHALFLQSLPLAPKVLKPSWKNLITYRLLRTGLFQSGSC